jgi:hypothetical protein
MINEPDLKVLNQEITKKITGEEELSHSKALGNDLSGSAEFQKS